MPKRIRRGRDEPRATKATTKRAGVFAEDNRGLLLDIVVFIANLFLMRLLTQQFIKLFGEVSAENPVAKLGLSITLAAMWILPAAGAVLKRWRHHLRRDPESKPVYESVPGGCLFNPLFYFCLNLVISAAVLTSVGDLLFGKRGMDTAAVAVPTIIGIFFLTVFQTFLIYRYFSPPKRRPRWKFLTTPQSAMLGDVCLFLNMILFQVFWNMLTFAGLGHPSGVTEFLGRLFLLCFLALLIYFPPRMIYLADDIRRRRTWLMMLLANSPVIIRVLIGSGTDRGW
jgi:hypothetical protein